MYMTGNIVLELIKAVMILFAVRYMKVMELHWQCQKVITHVTNLRRFMQSHNYDDKVKIGLVIKFKTHQIVNTGFTENGAIVE